jgi:hypothetical protein
MWPSVLGLLVQSVAVWLADCWVSGKIYCSLCWGSLIKVLHAGDSRYSILRGPHLVDFGVGVGSWMMLAWGVTQSGDSVAISVEAPCSKCFWLAGWLLGLRERSVAVNVGAL